MVSGDPSRHPLGMNTHTTHIPEIPEVRRLQRSRSDRMLAGVSGGLARYFEIHPAVFRVGFVVLTLLGGAGILIYAAAALVMPDEGKDDSVATAALRNRRDRPWPLIGLGLVAVSGAVLLSRATLWPEGDAWVLFLIAGAVILWITRHSPSTERAADGTETTTDVTELAARDSHGVRRFFAWVAIVFATLVALVILAAGAAVAIFDVDIDHGVGDRSYVVTTAGDLDSPYQLGIGSMKLDLRGLELPVGETHLDASVDIGDLLVTVPADVALQVQGSAEVGQVDLPEGVGADGRNVESNLMETGARVLVLDAHVGAGSVRVERALR